MPKRVAVLQSAYLPWKGYFDLIHDVDEFVFYDDVQYTRQDWRNRNRIKTERGLEWLTIPVGTRIDRRICDVLLPASNWAGQHWQRIESAYAQAPWFAFVERRIRPVLLDPGYRMLSELNQALIRAIASLLGISVCYRDSRELTLLGTRQDRLLSALRQTEATIYVSGPSAQAYLDPGRFDDAGIELIWKDYSGYPMYPQLHGDFVQNVSILDLLVHVGPAASQYIWGWRTSTG